MQHLAFRVKAYFLFSPLRDPCSTSLLFPTCAYLLHFPLRSHAVQ